MTIPEFLPAVNGIPTESGRMPFYIGLHRGANSTMHYHRFAELSFIVSGKGTDFVNGKQHPLVPGTASLTLPNQIHHYRSEPGHEIVKFCCMFDLELLPTTAYDSQWPLILNQVGDLVPSHIAWKQGMEQPFRETLERLLNIYEKPEGLGRATLILGMLTELIALFVMEASGSRRDRTGAEADTAGELFWSIFRYVNANCRDPLTLRSTARYFHISPAYVVKLFKANIGNTFLGYLHQLRVDRAAGLLLNTELRVSEIAYSVGFESLRTFSRVFRELKGVPPAQFRKAYLDARKDYPADAGPRTTIASS